MAKQADAKERFELMTTRPVPGLILSMALPAICSMIVSSLYNFADTYYVSQISTSAAAAPGIAQPLFLIIQAVSLTFATGAGSYAARTLGSKDNDTANKTVSTAFFLSVIIGTIMGIISLIFLEPMMRAFGATDTILPYAVEYAFYVIIATPFFSATFVLSYAIRQEGNAKLAVVGTIAGAIINIVLDPIFIFTFHMGIMGAAVATSLSQIVSFCILFFYMKRDRCVLKLKWKYFAPSKQLLWEILKIGSPDFFRTCLSSVAAILLNTAARPYGDAALASMTVVTKIITVIVSILMGFGQGFQPMCGYNYGAGLFFRVKEGFRFTMITGLICMTVVTVFGCIFAPEIMMLFRKDDLEFIQTGSTIFRAQLSVLLPATVTIISNMLFQSCGRAVSSAVLALSRNGVVFIPLILVLPNLFDLNGVIWAQPVADVITFAVAVPMVCSLWKKLSQKEVQKQTVS